MTFTTAGGDGSGGVYVLIALILAPFVVGLAFRLYDRRAGDRSPAARTPLTWRRWWIRTGISAACFAGLMIALVLHADALAAAAGLSAVVIAPTKWPPVTPEAPARRH